MNNAAYIAGYLNKDQKATAPKKKKVKSREDDLSSFVNSKLKRKFSQ